MKEEYGIDKLTDATNWSVKLISKIIKLVKKGKSGKRVNGWDAIQFIKPLFELIALIGSHQQLGKEWKDLSDSEKIILRNLVKNGLEIEDDEKAKEIAERIFFLLLEIGDFITDVSN